jgi:hypothetical protein
VINSFSVAIVNKPSRALWALLVISTAVPLALACSDQQKISDSKLEAIIQAVRDGDQLFQNVDFEYEQQVTLLLPTDQIPRALDLVRNQNLKAHLVVQDAFFYLNQRSIGESAKRKFDETTMFGYDGKLIRTLRHDNLQNKGYANLVSGQLPRAPWVATPQSLGCDLSNSKLSQVLDGSSAGTEENVKYRVAFDGDEVIDGIHCVRIIYECQRLENGKAISSSKDIFWLAPEKHFLPVKDMYFHGKNREFAEAITETGDWREIETGIYVPFRAVKTNYAKNRQGKIAPDERTITTVKRVSIRPNYALEFFQNVEIPKGDVVYVQEGDAFVDNYIMGQDRSTSKWKWPGLLMAALSVVLILAGVYFLFIKSASRKIKTTTT